METTFEFRKLLRLILQNIMGIFVIFIFSVSALLYTYFSADRIYLTKTLIEIDTETNNLLNTPRFLSSAGRINLPEQAKIYKSRSALSGIIRKYNLDLYANGNIESSFNKNYYQDLEIQADK